MCRLRTGRLIHQGFQKQKRILFCYSGKTLATLSVWYTGGWFCYGPPVHGTWIPKILENGSGQWVWLPCVYRMSSCCLVLALPQKKAAHDCRMLCGWKDTDFVIKKHHSLLDGSVGKRAFYTSSVILPASLLTSSGYSLGAKSTLKSAAWHIKSLQS